MNLTPKQQEIVNFIDGPLLVTAGPGSGKTRVLTQRIINIVQSKNARVLALTFSNKAAKEIQERIEEDLYEKVEIGTIHSFCLEIVLNKGNQIGLPDNMTIIEDYNDKLELLDQAIKSLSLELNIKFVSDKIKKYKQNLILPEMISKTEEEQDIILIYETYNNILFANRVLDFDDILFYAYRILIEKPRIAKNYMRYYKYLMVDEAQDLNLTQYRVIKALTQNFSNIMMVGDSSQSIYGFNGSDSKIMTENFVKDFHPREIQLRENFRSSANIIKAAKIIQPNTVSKSVYPLKGLLQINNFVNEESEAEWIVSKIEYLLKFGSDNVDGPISYADIAILGRNKYLFKNLEKLMSEKEIPFFDAGSSTRLNAESEEIAIFENGLKVIANKYDELSYSKVVNMVGRKKNEEMLNDLLFNDEAGDDINRAVFKKIIECWQIVSNDIDNFGKAINDMKKSIQSEKSLSDNLRFLIENDLNLWLTRWQMYCKESIVGDRNLSRFLNNVSLGKHFNNHSEGVSLLTVHGSKGLEYSIVFVLGLNQGTFPDYRAKTLSQLQEERNNMFVAITRAKRECYLSYVNYKMMPWGDLKKQQISEYLNDLTSRGNISINYID
ncbi:ATP-dependent helicase [Macrococcus equipercicus]|uniref:DNA 3'-5' helicase n=1 Tax=Macrococcus equipercicus TaxID=69967 RepID=A0A9Q9BVQ4_9STAP|nr:ATP-dependent helicase [Macrococcus equipercicus]UTH14072.1 ATP-dependent helicase [Macrococcus equipercicus]